MTKRDLVAVALGAVAATALAGGVALATIPSPDGTIHACYVKSGSAIIVIDASVKQCSRKQTALTWNVQGPAGTPGAQGIPGSRGLKGDKGDRGDPGISTVTFAFTTAPQFLNGFGGPFKEVVAKNLPPGSWAIVATVNTTTHPNAGGSENITDMSCQLRNGDAVIGSATDRRITPGSDTAKRSVSMNGGAYLPLGGRVSVWCFTQFGDTVDQAQMMMMRVGGFS